MILALEGISAVGKSSIATALSRAFGFDVYQDQVRHGILGELSRREMYLTGNQCGLDLSFFSGLLDFVADRWCLSSYVYDTWGDVSLEGAYVTQLLPMYVRASSRVYLLRLDPELALSRMLKRSARAERAVGPSYSLQQLRDLDVGFSRAARIWGDLGGCVLEVDATDVAAAARVVIEDVLLSGILR